jgi:WD40 repeat protein
LDKKIILYDLITQSTVRVIAAHETSVKQLCYIEGYGGYLVSIAFEVTAKVWQISNIHGNCYLGQLRGLTSCIASIAALPDLPYVVCIDEKQIVTFYDVINMQMLQQIFLSKSGRIMETFNL